jgi:hypothetical protein
MQATADSRIVSTRGIKTMALLVVILNDIRKFPSRDISKCPAIKFAVSRTQSVIGRIKLLVNSIITIKGINGVGVPCGTRWANMWFVFFDHPNIIKAIQKLRERGRVIVICLVGEKIWGYKARKFIIRILKNKDIIIASVDFSVFPSENFTSFLNVAIIFPSVFFVLSLIFHILGVTNIGVTRTTSQAEDIKEELGSNTENRFVIIL